MTAQGSGVSAAGKVDFRAKLLAEVLSHAEIEGQEAFLGDAFTDLILDDLESEGRWPDYQVSHYQTRGAAVSAWAIDPALKRLYLAISDFERADITTSINRTEISTLLKRLTGFLTRCREGRIDLEDHHPAADLVDVAAQKEAYDSVALYVLTDRNAPDSEIEAPEVEGIEDVTVRVWDLEIIRRSRNSGERLDPIEIDFADVGGLPCLAADQHDDVQTYLAFIPGRRLASIYLEHGGRLLERNVRAFLSARGKINRGIRDTIREEPERFLAYNNGLTATAASVTIESADGAERIRSVHDFQIVNGGQTTASLAVAARDQASGLDDVNVQMKLVVVGAELIEELVPNISRFANRQNNVQESDLSANNDYLVQIDQASRSTWTPAAATGRPTKWYFERARGSYAVDQTSFGTPSAQRKFLAEYPKSQKFGKNELALYENTWAKLPHLVCRGGQKNFVEFMERLPPAPEEGAEQWYRDRFHALVAKAIIFKTADTIVRKNLGGTYKRQVVAYTLCYLLEASDRSPDLKLIWRSQQISEPFAAAIASTSGPMKEAIVEAGAGRNITEWTKQEDCWAKIRALDIPFEPLADPETAPERAKQGVSRHTTGDLTLADAIEAAQGVHIEGRFRRYRRRRWSHLGDTGVRGELRGTLHAYSAPMRNAEGSDYIFNVIVDAQRGSITPLNDLDEARRSEVLAWMAGNDLPT